MLLFEFLSTCHVNVTPNTRERTRTAIWTVTFAWTFIIASLVRVSKLEALHTVTYSAAISFYGCLKIPSYRLRERMSSRNSDHYYI